MNYCIDYLMSNSGLTKKRAVDFFKRQTEEQKKELYKQAQKYYSGFFYNE